MKRLFLAAIALPTVLLAVVSFARISGAHVQERDEKNIDGTWEGALAGRLRMVITLTPSGDGAYTGSLSAPEQHVTHTIQNATLNGDRVHFEIARVGGVYEGYLIK